MCTVSNVDFSTFYEERSTSCHLLQEPSFSFPLPSQWGRWIIEIGRLYTVWSIEDSKKRSPEVDVIGEYDKNWTSLKNNPCFREIKNFKVMLVEFSNTNVIKRVRRVIKYLNKRERYLFEMFKELRDMSPWKKMEFLNETE